MMDILVVILVAVGFQVSIGQELSVECFIGNDSCSSGSGFMVSSSIACCQSQPNIDTSYHIRNQCIICPAVAFEFRPVATVTEGSMNNVEVCLVSIEGDVINSTISVIINTVQESAFGFNDYIPLTGVELVFSPGDVEQCVNISLMDDDSFEEEELFRVVGVSNENGVVIGDLIINISDNDDIVIGIPDTLPVNVSEGDPFVTAVVEIISGKLETPVTLLVSTEDISAIGGVDYTSISNVSLVLSGQVSSVRVDIELREDSLLEGLEVFRVALQLMNQGLNGITFDSQTKDISIADNDRATIGFLAQSLSIAEASPAIDACFIVKSGDIVKDLVMDITFIGEAIEGVDFNNISMQYLINGDTSSGCVTFGPIDDEVLENDEITTITLRTNDDNVDIDIDQLIITIIDNEELETRFSNTLKEYSEDVVSDTVCVEIIPPSGGLERSVTVTIDLISDPELNVMFESQNVTFSNDVDIIKCIPVMVIDDSLVEGNKTIVFSLSSTDDDVTVSTPVQSFVLQDNDDESVLIMSSQVCTLSDELKLETFHMEGLSSGLVYDFSEGCEHVLLSSCDLAVDFEVRIDFFHNAFSTRSLLVSYNGQRIIYKDNAITELSANISMIDITHSSSDLNIHIPDVGINLVLNTTLITIYYTPSSIHLLSGLCGNTNGDILLANCNDVFNTSEISVDRIDEFIDGYRVKQTELMLGPQRVECGISGNSTVIGDPLFTTPILPDVSDIAVSEPLSLCYEIHGEPNAYFNLITDECITVNAHYVQPSLADYLNVMDLVTVVAIDNQNSCHRIQMDVNGCKVTFDGIEVKRNGNLSEISRNDSYHVSPFVSNGVEIRLYNNRAQISVPNCADLSVSMWIACQNQLVTDPYTDVPLGYVPMLKVVVNSGINIQEQSHGLIGQFWNIPVNITKYIGQLNSDIKDPSDYFLVSFNHHSLLKSKQFVGIVHDLTWSRENGVCLFVGNKQGGPIGEVERPNDPVIEGDYRDYIVDSRFDTDFKYSTFKTEMCDFN